MNDRGRDFSDSVDPETTERLEITMRSLFRAAESELQPSDALRRRIENLTTAPANSSRMGVWQQILPRRYAGPARLFGGLALTTAIAFALLLGLRVHRNDNVAAADVRAALLNVRTWHLHGWRMRDGRQTPWEVWGRKTPFLYWEKSGADITYDDGRQRIAVFAPDAQLGRKQGIIVRTAAVPDLPSAVRGVSYRNMVESEWWTDQRLPSAEMGGTAIFRSGRAMVFADTSDEEVYTVDRANRLPTSYARERRNLTHTSTEEYLQAEYNVTLPAEASVPPQPAGYSIVDARRSGPPSGTAPGSVSQANGLTLESSLLGVDKSGSLLVRIRTWLGDTLLAGWPGGSGGLSCGIGYAQGITVGEDDDRRAYIALVSKSIDLPNGDHAMLFTPVEPMRPGERRPASFHTVVNVSPGAQTEAGFQMLFTQPMAIHVSLPDRPTAVSIESELPPGILQRSGAFNQVSPGRRAPIETALDQARSLYYWERAYDASRQVPGEGFPNRSLLRRSTFWQESVIGQLEASNPLHTDRQIDLAEMLLTLGDTESARRRLASAQKEAEAYHRPASVARAEELERRTEAIPTRTHPAEQ